MSVIIKTEKGYVSGYKFECSHCEPVFSDDVYMKFMQWDKPIFRKSFNRVCHSLLVTGIDYQLLDDNLKLILKLTPILKGVEI